MTITAIYRLLVALAVLAASAPLHAQGRSERRVALVVGNGAYEYTSWLANPPNDAADMAAALEGLGFEVIKVVNGRGGAMADTFTAFSHQLRDVDAAVFYYAGHGVQFGGHNYALPIDARLDNEFTLKREAFAIDDVLAVMEQQAKISLVFLDACRDNPIAERLARGPSGSRGAAVGRGLARMDAHGTNTLLMFATAPGDVAEDGGGRNSPFAEALLHHIGRPGIDVEALLKDVTSEVRQATRNRQRPERLSRLESTFMFKPASLQAVVPGPSAPPPPARAAANDTAQDERMFWEAIKDTTDAALYQSYLDRFPRGLFADIARSRLTKMSPPRKLPPSAPAAPGSTGDADVRRFIELEYLTSKEAYADRVDYYDHGTVARAYIQSDQKKYRTQWPSREARLRQDSVRVAQIGPHEFEITFDFTYKATNGPRDTFGRSFETLKVREDKGALVIYSVKEIPEIPAMAPGWCDFIVSRNVAENTVCADSALGALDMKLQKLFDQLYDDLPPQKRAAMDTRNDAWSAARDACAGDRTCLTQSYEHRISQLEKLTR